MLNRDKYMEYLAEKGKLTSVGPVPVPKDGDQPSRDKQDSDGGQNTSSGVNPDDTSDEKHDIISGNKMSDDARQIEQEVPRDEFWDSIFRGIE